MVGQDFDPVFHFGPEVMLRAPVRPWSEAGVEPEPDGDDDRKEPYSTRALADFLARAADPLLDEALAVSSPSLAGTVRAVREGATVKPAAVRRAALAVARYQLRASSRSTPFGLLAGVSLVRFGARTAIRGDGDHRRAVGADWGWLTALFARWERDAGALARLRVVADNLAVIRGDRVHLPFVVDAERGTGERSVRCTPVVRAILRLAARPIPYPRLCAEVARAFPSAPPDKVAQLVGRLVTTGVLLTDLRPSAEEAGPIGRALGLLGPAELTERTRAELTELVQVREEITRYARSPLGSGRAALARVTERMARLQPAKDLLTVDLALDASGRLHHSVGEELCRAATMLWHLAPADTTPGWLRNYHGDFLERYGPHQAVPVSMLLDSEFGLGPPSTGPSPAGNGSAEPDPVARTGDAARDQILAQLAADAGDPGGEVVLDDAVLARLRRDDATPPRPSMDLYAELIATGPDALDRGDFRLVLPPWEGSHTAGAMYGRFARVLGDEDLPARVAGGDDAPPDLLTFQPRSSRMLNLVDTGRTTGDRVVVGAFHDGEDPGVLPLDDLAVVADEDELRIVSRSRRRVVRAVARHMLNPQLAAPHAARFLQEVALMGRRSLAPWSWGPVQVAPFLPRVRYGRTVVSPATWRLGDPVLADRDTPWDTWRSRFAKWRERWQVPAAVRLGWADQRIRLDLDREWHQWLLRDHLVGGSRTVLREDPSVLGPVGWFQGSRPPSTTEIVVSLHAVPERRERTRPEAPAALVASADRPPRRRLPGGPWLYAKLYAGSEGHDALLAGPLAALTARLPAAVDQWFFIRYSDPRPHLRLRFHGDPAALNGELLAGLHAWAGELLDTGRARDFELACYEPETERYGGPEALAAAEEVFHADSVAVLAQLRDRATDRAAAPFLVAAAGMADITRHLLAEVPGAAAGDWLTAHIVKSETRHRAFRDHRADALRLIPDEILDTPGSGAGPPGALPPAVDLWRARASALREYGGSLRRLEAASGRNDLVDTALGSLLHMHHNRLIGIDPESEQRALAVARGAVAAHASRRRATRR